ncbi:putative membrane protein [Desulfomicrobium apsheronum]|jgi:putative membrane protein|uniref:Putative membrane protein n=1 Tax=Desulfomicrobium apsheronum TaxID=52560 RepID=A0A1I3V3I7_9BACT|nr:putative membrane protein [Desulfomicrobium apsheronum]
MWNCGTLPGLGLGGWIMGHSPLWGILLLVGLGMLICAKLWNRRGGNPSADRSDSMQILKIRLARGEINMEEYNNLRSML